MNRKEALHSMLLLTGGAFITLPVLSGCRHNDRVNDEFNEDDIIFLDEVAETIIPNTPDSPGAKEAKVGAFMKKFVTDCYGKRNREVFIRGIAALNERCNGLYKMPFVKLSAVQKRNVLIVLDREAKKYQNNKKEVEPDHYFCMMKDLTVFGYFTSEAGAVKALRYLPVPGRFNGEIKCEKGDRAWAI